MVCVVSCICRIFVLFFKQKTAYEMRISDWSSDVCSSDLADAVPPLVTKFIDRAPAIEKDLKELPREKQLSDFDDKQLGKLAKLMKVDVAALKDRKSVV